MAYVTNVTDFTNSDGDEILRSNNFEIEYGSLRNTSRVATLSVTSAQLKALKANSLTIVPAAGASTIIIPSKCIFEFTYVAPQYVVTDVTIALMMNGVLMGSSIAGSVFLGASASEIYTMPTPDVIPATAKATLVNKSLSFQNIGAEEMTTGNGTLFITLFYDVFTTS